MTLKKYFHIGIAVDTEHGLMVPKIRNVDTKKVNEISEELKSISDKCRKLKIDKKEFYGGSMTITSLGGIGGSFFTPIINYPEVAILGVGKLRKKQIYLDGEFKERIILPLSLSYDHRIIDGAEAARFNNELKENLGKNFAYRLAIYLMTKTQSMFAALLCTFIWGTTFIAQDTGMEKIGPYVFNSVRFFVGFLVLIPFYLLLEKKNYKRSFKQKKKKDFFIWQL